MNTQNNNGGARPNPALQKKPPVPVQARGPQITQRQPFGQSAAQNQQKMDHNGLRSQLNQTNGNFNSKMAPAKAPLARVPLGKAVTPLHPIETEILMIYNQYRKTQDMITSASTNNQLAKLMATFDIDKWKKKFFLVFTRERGTLDLSVNPQLPLDLKNISLNPQAASRQGEKILSRNSKFWVVFIRIVADRLNEFAKATLRARLFGNTGETGLFSESKEDCDLLIKEVGNIIDAEKLQQSEVQEHLPVFGATSEAQPTDQPFNGRDETQEHVVLDGGVKNETFTKNELNGLLIDSPSEDYVVRAPVLLSQHRSLRGTPQFQEDGEESKFDYQNDESLNEEQVEFEEQEEEQEEIVIVGKPDQTFYTCINEEAPMMPNVTFDQRQYVTAIQDQEEEEEVPVTTNIFAQEVEQEDSEEEVQLQIECVENEEGAVEEQDLGREPEEDNQEQIMEEQQQVDVELNDMHQEKSETSNHDQIQEVQEEVANLQLEEPNMDICQQTIEIKEEASDPIISEENQIIQPSIEEVKVIEEPLPEVMEIVEVARPEMIEITQPPVIEVQETLPQKNPKKRKRSPSVQSTVSANGGMSLRSRFKQRKLNDGEEEEKQLRDEICADQGGSSYIRYEIIEKKGKQMLVPVRYSIRKALQTQSNLGFITDHEVALERQIINNEIDFEYKPNEMEGLFTLDQTAQDIKKLLLTQSNSKREQKIVEVTDIKEVVSVSDTYALLKVKKEVSGHTFVAVMIGKQRTGAQQFSEFMEQLLTDKKIRGGVMLTQASEEAIKYIKKNTKLSVKRNQLKK